MIDRHPAMIVRCTGVADVITIVHVARAHNLLVAVRGGSHNVAGHATCAGGLVIDLSQVHFHTAPLRVHERERGDVCREQAARHGDWDNHDGTRQARRSWRWGSWPGSSGGGHGAAAQPKPAGEMRWALYVTFPPAWLDPAEVAVAGQTPFWILYALHDALIKPMPGNLMTPSLAESWTVSDGQRVYEFKLREGLTVHNGDPFTAEDVKFSFLRYKSTILHEKVREVEIVNPYRVRFHLHQPWPDFLAYYGTLATGAAWIVPKKYLEQVGDAAIKQRPVGLGPYKFVSQTPGLEAALQCRHPCPEDSCRSGVCVGGQIQADASSF